MLLIILFAFCYILWICVPMLPAMFIYSRFPKEKIGIQGPLGALTVSATGAFAAYVIVFLISYPIVTKFQQNLASLTRPAWQVKAKITLEDETKRPIDPSWLDGLVLELHPDMFAPAKDIVTMTIPEINGSIPNIVLSIPNFGSAVIDTSDPTLQKDEYLKFVKVPEPVVIKRFAVETTGMAANLKK